MTIEPTAADDLHIAPVVAERLGYYVYLYVDPRNGQTFYVGKGKNGRALSHLSSAAESRKSARIAELRDAALRPRIEILAHAIADEETAFRIEAAVIDLLGLDSLTNEVRGLRSLELGRIPLEELMMYYAAEPATVDVPAVLIRINRLYRHTMSAHELYEATRGVWKMSRRREKAEYAFAVFNGVVREVYRIDKWSPAGTTPYTTRDSSVFDQSRHEFVGHVDDELSTKYVGKSVESYFTKGMRSPVVYVNC